MGRRLVRMARSGALVSVCTVGALAAGTFVHPAYAQPGPPGGGGRLEQVRKEIAALHDRAGSATDAYNAAESKASKQRSKVRELRGKVASTERRLASMRDTAGAMARAQYRGGGLPDEAKVMLQDDPEAFLHSASLARKGQQAAKGFLADLSGTRSRLRGYADDAASEWERLDASRAKKAKAKKRIERQLKQAKRLESQLAEEERKRLRKLEDEAAAAAQERWLDSGVLEKIDGKASKAGKRALEYAAEQLGKEYEWGAEGPRTFDCSGLTMRAWQAAGERVPRTSQEQWKHLPRVPVERMRPGDLLIYKQDASHVGIYVGDGEVLHAPRTGRQITVEGAGAMPILGVVRPDK